MNDWVLCYLIVAMAVSLAWVILHGDLRIWRIWQDEVLAMLLAGILWLPILLCWALRPDPGRPTWHIKNAWRRWRMRGFYWVTGSTAPPVWARLYAPDGSWVLLTATEIEKMMDSRIGGRKMVSSAAQEHLAKIWEMAQARKAGQR